MWGMVKFHQICFAHVAMRDSLQHEQAATNILIVSL